MDIKGENWKTSEERVHCQRAKTTLRIGAVFVIIQPKAVPLRHYFSKKEQNKVIYPDTFEHKIEFTRIRQLLIDNCLSTLGKEKVQEMAFSSSFDTIHQALMQTDEFLHILQSEENFPSDYFYDVRHALSHLRVQGTWIELSVLFDMRRSLQTIQTIVAFLRRSDEELPRYPHLSALVDDVAVYPEITKRIDSIMDGFGQMKDNASPTLANIRREMTSTLNGISRSLNSILRQAQSEGIVDKDVSPTMRDGRLVIPVNPSYKRKIKGIVHDESASGKTVFIEPAEVVEANNRIRELENDERREVIRILVEFSDYLRPYLPDVLASYDVLAHIDFIRAKARFSQQIHAIVPAIEPKQQIDWVQAVHPLLYLSLKKQHRKVVPLDIELQGSNRILIISGPNAGGKSVCLKTVGLLQYMVQCGLPIPLRENSHVGIFDHIFIDIGDEQSIENDLSTYSSHLMNMKHFVKFCTDKTLLLIDEFGSGTEPQIGAAIAEALLERFNNRQAFGVITTHYQNLKHFAAETEGIVNGSMLYDRHQMQPLFSLSIGNPGSSFAVEIARKIGLPEEVIQHASDIVGSDYINMDKYLQDIARDKRYWERKREEIRRERKRLGDITEQYEADIDAIKQQKKAIIADAKQQADKLLTESNARIENTIREIKEAQADKEKTRQIRQSLHAYKDDVRHLEEGDSSGLPKRKSKQKKHKSGNQSDTTNQQKTTAIAVGDNVRIIGQTAIGQVLDVTGKKAQVAFGMIKSTVDINRLERLSNNQIKREGLRESASGTNARDLLSERRLQFKQDIDVRGMRGDEAVQAVMYFVDDALQLGISRIRILHGTGTGALRMQIRQYLGTVQGVTHFRDEHVQFGGAGITVVELA